MYSLLIKSILAGGDMNLESLFSSKGKIYTFLNPVSYLSALDNKPLFAQFDGIFADGGILVKAIKLLYGKTVVRRSFDMTSLAPMLFSFSVKNHKSIAIIATTQGMVEKSVNTLRNKYPGLNIEYYRNGYFSSDEEIDAEAKKLVTLNPDFLIVGMGIIKQEQFLLKAKQAGYQGIGFTCGGFIHQTALNKADYYPDWVDKHNLRFLYRMYKEPHTRKRYAKAAFVFPIRFIWEKFSSH